MTIKEFVDDIKDMDDNNIKKKFKEIIKAEYIPISVKQIISMATIEKCVNTDKNGVMYYDEFVSKINYILMVFTLLTKLKLNKENPFEDYDLIMEYKLLNILLEYKNEEINELKDVYSKLENTYKFINIGLESIIEKTIASMSDEIMKLIKYYNDSINDEVVNNV